jgi:hypothetical protein
LRERKRRNIRPRKDKCHKKLSAKIKPHNERDILLMEKLSKKERVEFHRSLDPRICLIFSRRNDWNHGKTKNENAATVNTKTSKMNGNSCALNWAISRFELKKRKGIKEESSKRKTNVRRSKIVDAKKKA